MVAAPVGTGKVFLVDPDSLAFTSIAVPTGVASADAKGTMVYAADRGNNAIVIVWDENDYSIAPNTNKVLLIVQTNYGNHGIQGAIPYNHFSLLKSIEAGLGLPCLNHACDANVNVMSDLFSNPR